jgi:hypothetical protein
MLLLLKKKYFRFQNKKKKLINKMLHNKINKKNKFLIYK